MTAPWGSGFQAGTSQGKVPREEFVDEVVKTYARNCEPFIHWGKPMEAEFFKGTSTLEGYLLNFNLFRGWIK